MDTIHLVMLRYTIDNSPLEDGGEQAELVRYAFADYASAELTANLMEADNLANTEYFVRSHSIVPAIVVSKQQASE